MRKGFTLVELAVVLLIIGLILGLAVKGGTLIDSARIKSEVRKLEKFQTAISAYVGRTGGLPPSLFDDTLLLDKKELLQYSYLNSVELNTDYKDDAALRWNFVGCQTETITQAQDGNPAVLQWSVAASYAPGLANICVTTLPDNATSTNLASSISVSNILSCSIEYVLDDLSYRGGSGRLYGSNTALPIADRSDNFEKCFGMDNSTPYGYKIY